MGICVGTIPEDIGVQRKGNVIDGTGMYERNVAVDTIFENVNG